MSLRTFLYPLLTTSLLALGACGGGGGGGGDDSGGNNNGGDNNGGDNSGQNSKQIRNAKFGTGVWTMRNSTPESGVSAETTYLVYNDGESVRITNCSLSEAFDEALTWTSDTTIINEAGDVTVTVNSDNSIQFERAGYTHSLQSIANPATLEISSPSSLATDGSNPACGFATGPVDGGEQSLTLMTLIGDQVYLLGANFSNGYQSGGAYTGTSESSSVVANADVIDAEFVAALNDNTVVVTEATNPSVEITSCSETAVGGSITGMTTSELGTITGNFDLSVASGDVISCAEYSEAPPEDNPEEATLPNISAYYDAPVCSESGTSGNMSGLWKIDELTVNALRSVLAGLTINEDSLDELLGDFLDSVFLVAETKFENNQSKMGFALCQATTANEPLVGARYIELDREGNNLGVSSDNSGGLDADFFNLITIKTTSSMVIKLDNESLGLDDLPIQVSIPDINLKRRSAKLGSYCMKSETGDTVYTTTSADLGCTGFFNKDAENLIAVNADINGRLALVFAEFNGIIAKGNYALGAGVLKNVWIKYQDITDGTLQKVHNAHFWIDRVDSATSLVSIPRTDGHFILQLEAPGEGVEPADADYVHGSYRSWRWR